MHTDERREEETRAAHGAFIVVGLVFLVSAVGGEGLVDYLMGTGLLMMGLLGSVQDRGLLDGGLARILYIAAALIVIVPGTVRLAGALLQALRILQHAQGATMIFGLALATG